MVTDHGKHSRNNISSLVGISVIPTDQVIIIYHMYIISPM